MKKVLITGSNGFIGRQLKVNLVKLGYEVEDFNTNEGSICNISDIEKINLGEIHHIFHLAAKTYVPESWNEPFNFYVVNSLGTLNILEVCRKFNISLTYISSYLYGNPEILPVSEEHELNPTNPYADSKFIAEHLCEFYSNEFNVNVSVIRPFNVYGKGQNEKFLIPYIIKQALFGTEIKVKDLYPKRDYIYLEDLIEAIILTMNNKSKYSVYNIGSGYSISVKQIIDIVQNILNINKKVISEQTVRKNELNNVIADITKANSELNWFPKYSLIEGLTEIIKDESLKNTK